MAILEVIACSLEDAIAAEQGGADRLEIISHFEVGGLTPPIGLVSDIIAKVKIPLRVMVRESESFFIKGEKNIERLCDLARSCAELGADGLVLGFTRDNRGRTGIDHETLARVLSCAPKLKATFHRAFDLLPNPVRAVAELKRHRQIDRILTNGGDYSRSGKIDHFNQLVRAAGPEIEILAGGGINEENIGLLRSSTKLREFHVGRAARENNDIDGKVQADRVRALIGLIRK